MRKWEEKREIGQRLFLKERERERLEGSENRYRKKIERERVLYYKREEERESK